MRIKLIHRLNQHPGVHCFEQILNIYFNPRSLGSVAQLLFFIVTSTIASNPINLDINMSTNELVHL